MSRFGTLYHENQNKIFAFHPVYKDITLLGWDCEHSRKVPHAIAGKCLCTCRCCEKVIFPMHRWCEYCGTEFWTLYKTKTFCTHGCKKNQHFKDKYHNDEAFRSEKNRKNKIVTKRWKERKKAEYKAKGMKLCTRCLHPNSGENKVCATCYEQIHKYRR